jgi:hypothetical protein
VKVYHRYDAPTRTALDAALATAKVGAMLKVPDLERLGTAENRLRRPQPQRRGREAWRINNRLPAGRREQRISAAGKRHLSSFLQLNIFHQVLRRYHVAA